MTDRRTGRPLARPGRPALLAVLGLCVLAGCRTYDDARVLQVLNQRGFGRKYVGDSNEILTIGIRDTVEVRSQSHADVSGVYTVRMDGVIEVPLLNEVFVAGYTPTEIAEALRLRYSEYYSELDLSVFAKDIRSKRFYMRGEVTPGEKQFQGDTTVWDAVMTFQLPLTADLDDIYVIRADPKHPLIIPVDLEKMLDHGDSSDNVLLREDDIVVVNPNFAGLIRNAVQILLAPIQPITQLFSGLRSTRDNYEDLIEGDDDENFNGFNNFGGGFGGFGGFGGTPPGGFTEGG